MTDGSAPTSPSTGISSPSSSSNAGAIAGGVVGGLAFLVLLVLGLLLFRRRRRETKPDQKADLDPDMGYPSQQSNYDNSLLTISLTSSLQQDHWLSRRLLFPRLGTSRINRYTQILHQPNISRLILPNQYIGL